MHEISSHLVTRQLCGSKVETLSTSFWTMQTTIAGQIPL